MVEAVSAPNPAGSLAIAELKMLRRDLRGLERAIEGKREDMFFLPYLSNMRIQASRLVVLSSMPAPAVFSLRIGSWDALFFDPGPDGVTLIHVPRLIDSGTPVSIFTAAGAEVIPSAGDSILSAYLIGTAEEEPPRVNQPELSEG